MKVEPIDQKESKGAWGEVDPQIVVDLEDKVVTLKGENGDLKEENEELRDRLKNLMKSVESPDIDWALQESWIAMDNEEGDENLKDHIWNLEQKIEIMEEEASVM